MKDEKKTEAPLPTPVVEFSGTITKKDGTVIPFSATSKSESKETK